MVTLKEIECPLQRHQKDKSLYKAKKTPKNLVHDRHIA